VVEDHEVERRAVSQILKAEGFTVFGAENADKALGYMDENIDVVLSDLNMGDVSGLDLLQLWKKNKPETQFILLTGHSSVNSAVEAIKAGAFDYVTKPINHDELVLLVKRAVEVMAKDKEIDSLRRRLDQKFGLDQIIGQSKEMKDVFAKIQRAAPVDSTVLILGESGTGKELVAQALHHNSTRKKGQFVAVNIAAVPPTLVESELFGHVRGAFTGATDKRMGRFEQADGGTLFIDEVGDFELPLQAKLLRVLETLTVTPVGGHEDRKVNVRVLAATSRDIRKMVEQGTFREDLYYRLNVVTITLPPLAERREDIVPLFEHFLLDAAVRYERPAPMLTDRQRAELMQRDWPGNVRELRNAADRMVLGVIDDAAVPLDAATLSLKERTEQFERAVIAEALEQSGGVVAAAADRLQLGKATLYEKIKRYGIAVKGEGDK